MTDGYPHDDPTTNPISDEQARDFLERHVDAYSGGGDGVGFDLADDDYDYDDYDYEDAYDDDDYDVMPEERAYSNGWYAGYAAGLERNSLSGRLARWKQKQRNRWLRLRWRVEKIYYNHSDIPF